LHLGAAAEELLCAYAREVQLTPSQTLTPAFDDTKKAIVTLSRPSSAAETAEVQKWAHALLSNAKNSVKHKRGREDRTVDFDAQEEGHDVIDRAISTYLQLQAVLQLPHLSSIQDFDSRRRADGPNVA
jgi:hypothetical protein